MGKKMKIKHFYKITNNSVVLGSGYDVPDGFRVYTKGAEPEELKMVLAHEALDNAKAAKRNEILEAFDHDLDNGVKCHGVLMNARFEDWQKLKLGCDLAKAAKKERLNVRDRNNNMHDLDVAFVERILEEMGYNYLLKLKKLWEMKDAVEASETIEELEKIQWETK